MKKKITSFEDLHVWQQSQELACKLYQLAETNEYIRKDYSLKDQLKRAVISISDNIAEGFEYNNNPDFHRFLRISKGSCGETRNKLLFIKRLNYLDDATGQVFCDELRQLGAQIGELIKKVKIKMIEERKGLRK